MPPFNGGARGGGGSGGERRVAQRYDARTLAIPIVCRVNPGHEVQLANLSAAGARVGAAFPLLPGRPLQLHLHSRGRRTAIETRVAWCFVTSVMPGRGMQFAAGLSFARWLDLAADLAGGMLPSGSWYPGGGERPS